MLEFLGFKQEFVLIFVGKVRRQGFYDLVIAESDVQKRESERHKVLGFAVNRRSNAVAARGERERFGFVENSRQFFKLFYRHAAEIDFFRFLSMRGVLRKQFVALYYRFEVVVYEKSLYRARKGKIESEIRRFFVERHVYVYGRELVGHARGLFA